MHASQVSLHTYTTFHPPSQRLQISSQLEDYKIRVGFVRSAKSYRIKIIEFTITTKSYQNYLLSLQLPLKYNGFPVAKNKQKKILLSNIQPQICK